MAASKSETSRCGLCRFYMHEGRRGGMCSQLDVAVRADLTACCLAASPFSSASKATSEATVGITDWESSRCVVNDAILTAKTPVKVEAVSVG